MAFPMQPDASSGLALPWRRIALGFLLLVLGPILLLAGALRWMTVMPGESPSAEFVPAPAEAELAQRLQQHVQQLAQVIGVRSSQAPEGLLGARDYLKASVGSMGLALSALEFETESGTFENLELRLPGKDSNLPELLLCAHYDSYLDTVGADDNASGVAVLLEIARHFASGSSERGLRILFAANEELPFYRTDGMGSRVYAKAARAAGDELLAAVSLESLGTWKTEPGSQSYPFPLGLCYPDRGDFLAFVGDLNSHQLVRRSVAWFRENVSLPSEGVAAPEWLPGIGWSDHASFWEAGYRGMMVTTTAPFRNFNYHTEFDVPVELDYERMARCTIGLSQWVAEWIGASD